MTTNGLARVHYHNNIKSTGNSAVYTPSTSIITEPLSTKYTVGETIGRGKFAVVKKCTNNETGAVLAAKYIKKRRRGKTCREEILREVVMLEMALDHPRLVNLLEVYETQQELILITEYCAGGELFTECILEEKFNEADVRVLMYQILEGLVYLHQKNIVHLDLKPQNILLTEEFPQGSVKICDLGFACLVNTGEDIRDIIGTPDYVAPEVLNYDPLGLYTDMWSLGVLTYVMLTTCSPFAADDKNITFANITTVNFDFPDDLFEHISTAAIDFIQKLLILEPSERMTAEECLQHEWLSGVVTVDPPLDSLKPCDTGGEPHTQQPQSASASKRHEAQYSEMSLGEDEDLNKSASDTVGGSGDPEEPRAPVISELGEENGDNGHINTDVSVHEEVHNAHIISELSDKSGYSEYKAQLDSNIPDMEIVLDRQLGDYSEELKTPDTESSVSVSDNRLEESDSGVATASSDYRSEATSGRSSTDIELAGDREQDLGYVDTDISDTKTDEDRMEAEEVCASVDSDVHGTSPTIGNKEGMDQNYNCANDQRTESNSTFNLPMQSCDEISMIEVSDPNKGKTRLRESDSFVFNSSSLEAKTDIFPVPQKLTAQSRDIRGRSSLGSINETIYSMSIGEKHKRTMSADTATTSGEGGSNADEIEYEFISVSKRVRSIEENLQVTKTSPYSPKLAASPKIARSPRIARHSRTHHHH